MNFFKLVLEIYLNIIIFKGGFFFFIKVNKVYKLEVIKLDVCVIFFWINGF